MVFASLVLFAGAVLCCTYMTYILVKGRKRSG